MLVFFEQIVPFHAVLFVFVNLFIRFVIIGSMIFLLFNPLYVINEKSDRSTNKSSSDYNVLKHSENTSNLSGDFVTIIPEGYVAEQLKSQRQQVLKGYW